MRNPGGYGCLICDDARFAERFPLLDGYGNRITQTEVDSFTCRHCCRVVHVPVRQRPEDLGGLCKCCMGLICPHCVNVGTCTPLEEKLAAAERRCDTLRSYGVL